MHGAVILVIFLVRIVAALLARDPATGAKLNVRVSWFPNTLRWLLFIIAVILFRIGEFVWGAAFLLAAYPMPLIEHVLVPSGVPWLSWLATRILRPPGIGPENRAAAAFFELRARARFGWRLGPAWLERVERELSNASEEPRGATVAARALLDAARGDFVRARALFNLGMNTRYATRATMAFCQAWLMADAAERGDWAEVRRVRRFGKRTRRALFMDGCAAHLLGQTPRQPLKLRGLWLLAPNRLGNRALLRVALTAVAAPDTPPPPEGLAGARDASVALLVTPSASLTHQQLRRLAATWEALIDDGELTRHFSQRLADLGATEDPDALAARFEESLIQLLADGFARATPESGSADVSHEPRLLGDAIDVVRGRLLDEIELLVGELPTGSARPTNEIEAHYRAWAEIRYLAERFVTLFSDDRPLFYDAFGAQLLNHGAWLNNTQHAHVLSHDVFDWLTNMVPRGHGDLQLLQNNVHVARNQIERP